MPSLGTKGKVPHMERDKFILNCPLEDNSLALSLSSRRVWISAHRIKPSALSSEGNRSQREQLPGTVLLIWFSGQIVPGRNQQNDEARKNKLHLLGYHIITLIFVL